MYRLTLTLTTVFGLVYGAQPPFSKQKSLSLTVTVGQNASIPCPISNNVDFFEWYKGGQKLSASNQRLKFKNNIGVLKIHKVTKKDEGHYRCHGINGFGLAVADVKLNVREVQFLFNDNADEVNNISPSDPRMIAVKEKPRFKESQMKDAERIVERPAENSVVFRCHPQGASTPFVQWYKDGTRLTEIDRDPRIKIFRWKIEINFLNLSDSGIYVCEAQNTHGFAYLNYTLRVTRPIISKSEFMGQDPVNTTVIEGGLANLQCRVRSSMKPHISWLKLVPEEELNNKIRLIPFDGKFYQVLNSTDVLDHPDGSFLNKLHIDRTTISDTGKYVCLAANTQGYIYRIAHLQVISKSIPETTSGLTGNPVTVIVVVSLTSLMMLACAIGALRYARCPQTIDPNPGSAEQLHGPTKKRLLIQNVGVRDSGLTPTESTARIKVHHHPKTHHHHFHQHSHHLEGSFKY